MNRTPAVSQTKLALKLIDKDPLEMTDIEKDLYLAPDNLVDAEKEIKRLRALVIRFAKNLVSEPGKAILLS
jgi:hypothetical protein